MFTRARKIHKHTHTHLAKTSTRKLQKHSKRFTLITKLLQKNLNEIAKVEAYALDLY